MSRRRLAPVPWRKWLRELEKHPRPDCVLPGSLAMLTGQDARALEAVAACWELYACSDEDGMAAALEAVRALLGGMQPKCRGFARALIARAMDWPDQARVWPLVSTEPPAARNAAHYCPNGCGAQHFDHDERLYCNRCAKLCFGSGL